MRLRELGLVQKGIVDKLKNKRAQYATLIAVDGNTATIRLGSSPNYLRNIKIVGEAAELKVGQTVALQWVKMPGGRSEVPQVLANPQQGAVSTDFGVFGASYPPDNQIIINTTSGLTLANGGVGLQHLSFQPALLNHTHDALPGWSVDSDGALVSGSTFIHPDGQISLGTAPDVLKLDSLDATYRFWIGAISPGSAPFSVTKAGAINATSGAIGGWTLGATQFSSDAGNAHINSATPSIGLGGTAYNTGTGFWVGKDAGAYKMHIGNPAGDKLTWDGTNLSVTGGITANSGSIGGWTLAASTLTSGALVLDSSVPSIEIGATTYQSEGVWMGLDGGVYKMSIGDPAGEMLSWDGNRLNVSTYNLVVGDVISTRSGQIIVAPTTILTSDLAAAATIIYVEDEIFDLNDVVVLKARGNYEIITITSGHSGTGPYSYNCSRGTGSSGADNWFIGDAVVNTGGAADDALIDIYANTSLFNTGAGPTIVGNVRADATWNNIAPRWALGNLSGMYGYGGTAYGAAFGEYASGKTNITIDSTNGVRIRNNTTVIGQWDASGDMILGQVGASKSNIFYDISTGRLNFRTNTTVRTYIDDEGSFVFNSGFSRLDDKGLVFKPWGSSGSSAGITWDDGYAVYPWGSSNPDAFLWSYLSGGVYRTELKTSPQVADVRSTLNLVARASLDTFEFDGGPETSIWLEAKASTGPGTDHMQFNVAGAQRMYVSSSGARINEGLWVGSNTAPTGTGDIAATADGRFGGGLVVGSTIVNPASGELRVSGGAYFGSTGTAPTSGVVQATSHGKFGGALYVGSVTGTPLDTGSLVLDQGAFDTSILEMRSSDVAHGMTGSAPTNTYALFRKGDGPTGSLVVEGFGESTRGLQLGGAATTAVTTKSTSSLGAVVIQGSLKDGVNRNNITTNGNIVSFYNWGTTRAIIDAEGDLHLDATSNINAWDDYNDIQLLTGLRASVMDPKAELAQRAAAWIEYSRPILESTGVMTYNEDGHHFVSMKNLQWLQIDAMRQLYEQNQVFAQRNLELEERIERMEKLLSERN